MRAEQKNWEEDDFELDAEFDDITTLVSRHQAKPPRVPGRLDRLIRKQADTGTRKLKHEWLFGPSIQLALVALIIFSIGTMYVASLQQTVPNTTIGLNPSIPVHRVLDPKHPVLKLKEKSLRGDTNSWVELSFSVNSKGKAHEIRIIDRCHRTTGSPDCLADIDIGIRRKLDNYAIREIQANSYKEPYTKSHNGSKTRTESVFVP